MANEVSRRKFLGKAARGSLVGAAATTMTSQLSAPAVAKGYPEMSWRLMSSFPKSLEIIHDAAGIFMKFAAEATDNRFKIKIVPPKSLVKGVDAATMVTKGKVEIAHTSSGFFWRKDPTFALGSGLPFGLNTRQMNAWILEGGGAELLQSFYAKHNIHAIAAGSTGCQMGGWWRDEIKSLDQLKGKKIVMGGFANKIMVQLGMDPQTSESADIVKAFERGRLDAVEWIGPYDDEKLGLHKSTKN